MTACNLIVRPEAAYLIADTAVFDADGTVTGFTSKINTSARLGMAIAITGRASSTFRASISTWLQSQPDQASALAELPALLGHLVRERDAVEVTLGIDARAFRPTICLAVALCSADTGKPDGYIIASDATLHRGFQPMQARRTGQFLNPQVAGIFIGHSPFDSTDAGSDLLHRQRATQHGPNRNHMVGGSGEVVSVSAIDIALTTVCTWPDNLGHRINPSEPLQASLIHGS